MKKTKKIANYLIVSSLILTVITPTAVAANELVQVKPETTEVATEESTEVATEESTETVTEESTEAVTEESTETVTEESTETVTEENTEVATEESTEAVTEESTETVTEENTEVVTEENTVTQPTASAEQTLNDNSTEKNEKNALPQINGVENVSILHGNDFDPLAGISALDSQGNPLEINITGFVDTLTMGVYELIYTATDVHGNSTSVNRTVTVVLNRNEAYVEDSKLKSSLNYAIGNATNTYRPSNAYISQSDALTLSTVTLDNSYNSLEGFQYFKNLKTIKLNDSYGYGRFTDLTPLSNLSKLEVLYIDKSYVEDLTPLSNLTNLRELSVKNSKIQSIEPIKYLSNLEYVSFYSNNIKNADVLVNLPNLKKVYLNFNLLTDVSKLAGLNLNELNLYSNKISDTSMFSDLNEKNINIKHQEIVLDAKEKDGIVTIENVVKLPNNQMFIPESISNNGRYLVDSNEIQWKNITTAQTVRYSFNDAGHSGTVFVKVSTDTKPTINGVKNFTVPVGSQFNPLSGVSASDREDGDLTAQIKVQSNININKLGTYPVTYSVTDSDGNTITAECLAKVDFTAATDWKDNWATVYIERAMEKGWVSTSAAFRPEDNITRAEFVKIVNQAFGYQEQAESEPYEDVKDNQWYYGEILKAVKAGYISVTMTNFRPEDTITREEVAAIITSIQNNKDTNLDKIQQYADYDFISEWARESVEGVVEAGYMGKGSDKFRPKSRITRAEAVVTLGRIFE